MTKKEWQLTLPEYASATKRTIEGVWDNYWRRFGKMNLIGSTVFIPSDRPKWGVVTMRVHDEITVSGDFYTYNEACRIARRVRLIHIKRYHSTRKFREAGKRK